MPTPRAQGFVMPPEWARHSRCWMTWPCRQERWGERFAAARLAFADVAKTIAAFEPVTMLARPDQIAEASLQCGRGISILPMDYDEAWTRDTTPTFLCDGQGGLAAIDWRYNGYGERAPHYADDARLAHAIAERLGVPRFQAPLVLEEGAIQVDGEGTCLISAEAALDPRRNPGLGRDAVIAILGDFLGVSRVIWLERGLTDDDSAGHVDNLACFVRPGAVLALTSRDPEDDNHQVLQESVARLRAERDAAGRDLEVIEIEQPAARYRADGRRLAASYISLYLANGAAIMPMFDDPMDRPAYRAVAAAFPDREVVQVDAGDLIHGGGGIHRITQQQPSCERA